MEPGESPAMNLCGGKKGIEYPSGAAEDFTLKPGEKKELSEGRTSPTAPDWLPEGELTSRKPASQSGVCEASEVETRAPTTEGGFGRAPAICPAPVGLAPIPAQRKLVRKCRHTKAGSSSSPSPKGAVLEEEAEHSRKGGKKKTKKQKRETKRIVGAGKKNVRQRDGKKF